MRELYGADFQVPDPQDPATFARSTLRWDEPARGEHDRLLTWYRTLLALRRLVPALASGDRGATDLRWSPGQEEGADGPFTGWLVLHRGPARVAVNLGTEPVRIPLRPDQGPLRVLASWGTATLDEGDAEPTLVLPGRDAAVLG
jgi:maltooligosyltrehalose trehalohydrolase